MTLPDGPAALRRNDAPPHLRGSRIAVALAAAVPVGVLLVGAAEIAAMPPSLTTESPLQLVGLLALACAAAARFVLPAIAYQAALALLLPLATANRALRAAAVLASLVTSALVAYLGYWILIRDGALAGHPPFVAAFAGLAFLLAAWCQLLFASARGGTRRVWLSRLRQGLAAAFLAGFVAVQLLNHRLLPGTYPSLHAAGLLVAYLLAHAGVCTADLSVRWASQRTSLTLGASALAALLLCLGAVQLGFAQRLEPALVRHTYVGDASAAMRGTDSFFDEEPVARIAIPPDPAGLRRFDLASGLPSLPDGWSLDGANVLLVSVEAFRFDATTIGSTETNGTPHLSALASDGAHWFGRAYTAAPVTYQSIASMFTMTFPSAAGISVGDKLWRGHLRDDLPTVPALLNQAGYRTFLVGHDLHLGGCERGFETRTRVAAVPGLRIVDQQVREAAERELTRSASEGRPFFGWVFFVSPHEPYLPHYRGMPASSRKDRYLHEVRYVDEQLGSLLRHVDRLGLRERTVLIVHGDHGEEFGEHGGEFHTCLYEECLHVPLVIRIPGARGGGHPSPVSLTYVFPWLLRRSSPTAAAAAELRITEDLAPLMARTEGAVVSERLWQGHMRSSLTWSGRSTLFDFRSRVQESYDLRRDPGQLHDLFRADSPAARRDDAKMKAYLELRKARSRIRYVEPKPDDLPL